MKVSQSAFKAISFDLDNALYDNQPVLNNAESISGSYLRQQFEAQGKTYNFEDFLAIRRRMLTLQDPRLENLSWFRQQALYEFCQNLSNSEAIAARAFELFIQARSQVSVPEAVYQMLESLSQKFILVSVTNGNCDVNQLSIGPFFSKNYSTTDNYRAKPHPQMLTQVLNDFSLQPEQLLHVGDSIDKDGGASSNAGVEFYHFAPFVRPDIVHKSCHLLLKHVGPVNI